PPRGSRPNSSTRSSVCMSAAPVPGRPGRANRCNGSSAVWSSSSRAWSTRRSGARRVPTTSTPTIPSAPPATPASAANRERRCARPTPWSDRAGPSPMRTPEIPPLRTLLDARRGQIADRWHMALAPTSFVPYGWQEVRDRLVELVERVLDVLCAEPLDRQGAQAVGADLAQLHY